MHALLHTALMVLALLSQVPSLKQPTENGTVTGVIRTKDGRPASGVRVAAFVVTDASATAGGGALASLAETDSSGRYHLENIPPGQYYIQAGLIDFPSYYPGVAAMDRATEIRITQGTVLEGLDFSLARSAGVRITGRIPTTASGIRATIRMIGGSGAFQQQVAQTNADGTFEFLRVPPGSYTLMVSPSTVAPNLPIVVNDKDIDLGLPTGPGVRVGGIVGLGQYSPHPANQKVILSGSSAWAQLQTAVDVNGRFEFPKVPAGIYSVTLNPGTSSSVASLMITDHDVADLVLTAIVELTGMVVMSDGSAMPALSPAMMVDVKKPNASMISTAVRPGGSFRLPLSEGNYTFALENLPPGFSVKSIGYGSSDITGDTLKLDGSAPPNEVRITLEK